MRKGTKMVAMPIIVPDSNLCWDRRSMQTPVCEYFTNEGGHSNCELGFWPLTDDPSVGVFKNETCLKLPRVK